MFSRQSLLLWWGITVTIAYLITQYIGNTMEHGHAAVLWTWGVAMAIPTVMTLLLGKEANTLIWVWVLITVAATLENVWVHATESKGLMPFSYHALWFVFGAIGFGYTAAVVDGAKRKQLYAIAAALHVIGAVIVFIDKDLMKGYEYIVLAVIQGVPMLLDLPLRKQHDHAAA
ncbi:hypothetical protein [Hymenobacter profundi]|uniref:Uncharacterized protein n=1 Tax=Hymenobacter profundi TaxID=1982110 RepID=A0ABS6X2Y8_9BACT|nr:hypothetical protein [Hymenobacter profundi]MBW3130177.1 hypothetical protein [Hymenobacter profundi]